uniref:CX domain-containing protein n=1 Tax=Acrobeloides nanus TaxID=290746 RepID=A0A914E997_9BILA
MVEEDHMVEDHHIVEDLLQVIEVKVEVFLAVVAQKVIAHQFRVVEEPGRSSSGIIGNNSPTYPYYQPQSIYNPIRPSSGPTNFFSNLASTAIGSAVGNGIGSYIGNSIFRHNNRNYYYGRENYQQEEVDEFMCSMPIEHLRIYTNGSCYDVNTKENYQLIDYDQILNSENETSTKEITWGCKIINEICCCTECCTLEKIKN